MGVAALYYFLDADGVTVHGPFSREDMWELQASNTLHLGTNVCLEGTEDWKALGEVPELHPPMQSARLTPIITPLPAAAIFPLPTQSATKAPPPTAAQGCCLGCGGLFVLFLISSLFSKCEPQKSSTRQSAEVSQSANVIREADTWAGFQEGRRIGNRRYREGFSRPTLAYLDGILAATSASQPEAWKVGFKGGYLSAWDNKGQDL